MLGTKIGPAGEAGPEVEDVLPEGSLNEAQAEVEPKARHDLTVGFLLKAFPTSRWALTAIEPQKSKEHKNKLVTATFDAKRADAARAWLDKYGAMGWNLYYHVNDAGQDVTKRLSEADVKSVRALMTDSDYRAGEDPAEERRRLHEVYASLKPTPTAIIFSGGGYQSLHVLKDPAAVTGPQVITEAKNRNRGMISLLPGADSVFSIDHLMRLPWTLNQPDYKKRAKGRTGPVLTELVAYNENAGPYALSDFPSVAGQEDASASTNSVHIDPAKVKRIAELSELDQWNVPARVKVIIAQGRHPEERKPDNSRSEWLFDACCNLARAKVPDEVIFSLITDKDWAISESVLDKHPPEGYARRQIERAKAEVEDKNLREMNAKHAVLLDGANGDGNVSVLRWSLSPISGRMIAGVQSFEDIKKRYVKPVTIGIRDGKPIETQLGKWWLNNPHRRELQSLTFDPGQPPGEIELLDGIHLNLWTGFAVRPKAGDWSLMDGHIKDIVCSGHEEHYSYVTRWLAWAVQNPGKPAGSALVLKGAKGAGKGTVLTPFMQLFGDNGLTVTQSRQITGHFNAHLRTTALLFADEAVAPGDRQGEKVLQTLITEPYMSVEQKGKDVFMARNVLKIVMSSNEDYVVPASADERRYAVFNVSPRMLGRHDYFEAIRQELATGGMEAWLHDLLAMDLGDWNPMKGIPQTDALAQQKELHLSPADQFLLKVLEEGILPGALEGHPGTALAKGLLGRKDGIYDAMREEVPALRDQSSKMLSMHLKRWGAVNRESNGRSLWDFPSLPEMRRQWSEKHGARKWDRAKDWGGRVAHEPSLARLYRLRDRIERRIAERTGKGTTDAIPF